MNPIKVGLIGCGRIAQLVHLKILSSLPNVQLAALAEIDSERLKEASHYAPEALTFTDYRELLARPEIQAVVICLPNALHAETAIAALNHNKHVYLEKPLAINLESAKKILESWKGKKLTGMIGFNFRFHRLYQSVKKNILSGMLGKIMMVRTSFSNASQILPVWKQFRESGGGVMLDLASHHIDLLRFIFEREVRNVFANIRSHSSEDDCAVVHLDFGDDLTAQSFFSMHAIEEDRLEIYGEKGKLVIDRYLSAYPEIISPNLTLGRSKRFYNATLSLALSPELLGRIYNPVYLPSYRAAFSYFIKAIQENRAVSPNFSDGFQNMRIIEAIEKSAKAKQEVALSNISYENFAY